QLSGGEKAADLLGVAEDLHAKAAADIWRDDAKLLLGNLEDLLAKLSLQAKDPLAASDKGEAPTFAVVIPDGAARLQGVHDDAIVDQLQVGDLGCSCKGGFDISAIVLPPVKGEISRRRLVKLRSSLFEGLGRHCRQRFLFDAYQLGGLFGP